MPACAYDHPGTEFGGGRNGRRFISDHPYQSVFWADVYAEMIGMDLTEQGAQPAPADYYWMHGPLTNDFDELRGIVGCSKKQWTPIYSKVLKAFVLGGLIASITHELT